MIVNKHEINVSFTSEKTIEVRINLDPKYHIDRSEIEKQINKDIKFAINLEFKDLPLYVNHENPIVQFVAKRRLEGTWAISVNT